MSKCAIFWLSAFALCTSNPSMSCPTTNVVVLSRPLLKRPTFFNRIFFNTWQLAITQGISKENLGKVANFTVYWNL